MGARWAINEPNSHSGCSVVPYNLGVRGQPGGYFREVVSSGLHQATLKFLRARAIDGSAIDSTVFDVEVDREPELGQELRTAASFGPSPIPSFVIRTDVVPDTPTAICGALTEMHKSQVGRRARRPRVFAAVVTTLGLLMLLGLDACGESASTADGASPISVNDALRDGNGTNARVTGFLVATPGQPVHLCEALAESYPPQCGRPEIEVEGLDVTAIGGLSEAQGVVWSDGYIEVPGVILDGRLFVDSN